MLPSGDKIHNIIHKHMIIIGNLGKYFQNCKFGNGHVVYRNGPQPKPLRIVSLGRNMEQLRLTLSRMLSTKTVPPKPPQYKQQNFDYFLVLDFEATCDKPQLFPMEIIEFPVLKLDCRTFEVVDKYHRYVRPTVHPQLTPFCTELTGIIQEMVDQSDKFSHVFKDFQKWLLDSKLINENLAPISRFTFITCGDWDLNRMLPLQCKSCNFQVPPYMKSWINVKKSFAEHTSEWPKSQAYLLEYFQIEPVGRAHSGIDDCYNLAEIVKHLAARGYVFRNNSRLKQD